MPPDLPGCVSVNPESAEQAQQDSTAIDVVLFLHNSRTPPDLLGSLLQLMHSPVGLKAKFRVVRGAKTSEIESVT